MNNESYSFSGLEEPQSTNPTTPTLDCVSSEDLQTYIPVDCVSGDNVPVSANVNSEENGIDCVSAPQEELLESDGIDCVSAPIERDLTADILRVRDTRFNTPHEINSTNDATNIAGPHMEVAFGAHNITDVDCDETVSVLSCESSLALSYDDETYDNDDPIPIDKIGWEIVRNSPAYKYLFTGPNTRGIPGSMTIPELHFGDDNDDDIHGFKIAFKVDEDSCLAHRLENRSVHTVILTHSEFGIGWTAVPDYEAKSKKYCTYSESERYNDFWRREPRIFRPHENDHIFETVPAGRVAQGIVQVREIDHGAIVYKKYVTDEILNEWMQLEATDGGFGDFDVSSPESAEEYRMIVNKTRDGTCTLHFIMKNPLSHQALKRLDQAAFDKPADLVKWLDGECCVGGIFADDNDRTCKTCKRFVNVTESADACCMKTLMKKFREYPCLFEQICDKAFETISWNRHALPWFQGPLHSPKAQNDDSIGSELLRQTFAKSHIFAIIVNMCRLNKSYRSALAPFVAVTLRCKWVLSGKEYGYETDVMSATSLDPDSSSSAYHTPDEGEDNEQKGWIAGVYDLLKNTLSKTWNSATDRFTSVVNCLKEKVFSIYAWGSSGLTTIWEKFLGVLSGLWNAALKPVEHMSAAVESAFGIRSTIVMVIVAAAAIGLLGYAALRALSSYISGADSGKIDSANCEIEAENETETDPETETEPEQPEPEEPEKTVDEMMEEIESKPITRFQKIRKNFSEKVTGYIDATMALVTGICGKFDYNVYKDTAIKCRNLLTIVSAGTLVLSFAKTIAFLLPFGISNMMIRLFGNRTDKANLDADDYEIEAQAILRISKNVEALTNDDYFDRASELMRRGARILKYCPRQRLNWLVHLHQQMHKLCVTMCAFRTKDLQRDLPFAIHVCAPSGMGKSNTVPEIINDAFNIKYQDQYLRPAMSEFFDGANNQKAFIYDELFIGNDEERHKLVGRELLFLCSTAPFMPNMASTDDPKVGIKGTYLKPDIVVTINNTPYNKPKCIGIDAFQRRRHYVIKIEFPEKCNITRDGNNIDFSQLTEEDLKEKKWMQFRILPGQENMDYRARDDTGVVVNYDGLIRFLAKRYADHKEICEKFRKARNLQKDLRNFDDLYTESYRTVVGVPNKKQPFMKSVLSFFAGMGGLVATTGEPSSSGGDGWTEAMTKKQRQKRRRALNNVKDMIMVLPQNSKAKTAVAKTRAGQNRCYKCRSTKHTSHDCDLTMCCVCGSDTHVPFPNGDRIKGCPRLVHMPEKEQYETGMKVSKFLDDKLNYDNKCQDGTPINDVCKHCGWPTHKESRCERKRERENTVPDDDDSEIDELREAAAEQQDKIRKLELMLKKKNDELEAVPKTGVSQAEMRDQIMSIFDEIKNGKTPPPKTDRDEELFVDEGPVEQHENDYSDTFHLLQRTQWSTKWIGKDTEYSFDDETDREAEAAMIEKAMNDPKLAYQPYFEDEYQNQKVTLSFFEQFKAMLRSPIAFFKRNAMKSIFLGTACVLIYHGVERVYNFFNSDDEDQKIVEDTDQLFATSDHRRGRARNKQPGNRVTPRTHYDMYAAGNEVLTATTNRGSAMKRFTYACLEIPSLGAVALAVPIIGNVLVTYRHWLRGEEVPNGTPYVLSYRGQKYPGTWNNKAIYHYPDRPDMMAMQCFTNKTLVFSTMPKKEFLAAGEYENISTSVCDLWSTSPKGNANIDRQPALIHRVSAYSKDMYQHILKKDKDGESLALLFAVKYGYFIDMELDPGACGQVIRLTGGHYNGRVAGMVVASSKDSQNPRSHITPIFQEDVQYAMDIFSGKMLPKPNRVQDLVATAPYKFVASPATGTNIVAITDQPMDQIPSIPLNSSMKKSCIAEDLVAHGFNECNKEPPILTASDPRGNGNPYDHVINDVKEPTVIDWDQQTADEVVDEMFSSYSRKIGTCFTPYTFEEAIRGVAGEMAHIPTGTSAGAPYCFRGIRKKDLFQISMDGVLTYDPAFKDEVMDMYYKFIKGEFVESDFVAYLKDELQRPEKIKEGKTRVIYCGDVRLTIIVRMLIGRMMAAIQAKAGQLPPSVGLNQYSVDMNLMKDYLDEVKGDFYLAGDYKTFDRKTRKEVARANLSFMKRFFKGPEYTDGMWDNLWKYSFQSPVVFNNKKIEFDFIILSGMAWLWLCNCNDNEINLRYTLKKQIKSFDFNTEARVVTLGDDHIAKIHEKYDYPATKLQKGLKQYLAQEYTSDVKGAPLPDFRTFSQITYLGACPQFERGVWHGAPKKDMLQNTLQYTRNDNKTILPECLSVIEYASLWDKETYIAYKNVITKAWKKKDIDIAMYMISTTYHELQDLVRHRTRTPPNYLIATAGERTEGQSNTYTKLMVDENTLEKTSTTNTSPANLSMQVNDPPATLRSGLETKVVRKAFTWTTDMAVGENIMKMTTPLDILVTGGTNNIQNMAFNDYRFVRFDMETTFVLKASKFYTGIAGLSWSPLDDNRAGQNGCKMFFTYRHSKLVPCESTTAVMYIKFDYPYKMYDLIQPRNQYGLGTLSLDVLSRLIEPSGQAKSVEIIMMSSFHNVEFYVPLVKTDSMFTLQDVSAAMLDLPNQFPWKYVARIANYIMRARQHDREEYSKLITWLQEAKMGIQDARLALMNYAVPTDQLHATGNGASTEVEQKTVNVAFSGANLNEVLGASQTPELTNTVEAKAMMDLPMTNRTVPTHQMEQSLSQTVGTRTGINMAMSPAESSLGLISQKDELSIENLCSKESILARKVWTTEDAAGDMLFNISLNSILGDYDSGGGSVVPPSTKTSLKDIPFCCYIMEHFEFYRCDWVFRIYSAQTKFHSGTIKIITTLGTDLTPVSDLAMYTMVAEFSDENHVVSFKIPYTADTEYKSTYAGRGADFDYCGTGVTRIQVNNPLVCIDTVPDSVELILTVSAENVAVKVPKALPTVHALNDYTTEWMSGAFGFKTDAYPNNIMVLDVKSTDDADESDSPAYPNFPAEGVPVHVNNETLSNMMVATTGDVLPTQDETASGESSVDPISAAGEEKKLPIPKMYNNNFYKPAGSHQVTSFLELLRRNVEIIPVQLNMDEKVYYGSPLITQVMTAEKETYIINPYRFNMHHISSNFTKMKGSSVLTVSSEKYFKIIYLPKGKGRMEGDTFAKMAAYAFRKDNQKPVKLNEWQRGITTTRNKVPQKAIHITPEASFWPVQINQGGLLPGAVEQATGDGSGGFKGTFNFSDCCFGDYHIIPGKTRPTVHLSPNYYGYREEGRQDMGAAVIEFENPTSRKQTRLNFFMRLGDDATFAGFRACPVIQYGWKSNALYTPWKHFDYWTSNMPE